MPRFSVHEVTRLHTKSSEQKYHLRLFSSTGNLFISEHFGLVVKTNNQVIALLSFSITICGTKKIRRRPASETSENSSRSAFYANCYALLYISPTFGGTYYKLNRHSWVRHNNRTSRLDPRFKAYEITDPTMICALI